MSMNFSVDLTLLDDKIFDDLKSTHRTSTLLIWSLVRHFTKHMGYVDLYQKKFAQQVGIGVRTIRLAEKRLLEAGYIKCTRAYQQKGNLPNRYVDARLGIRSSRVSDPMHKGWVSDTQVNNSKGIIKPDDSSLGGSSSMDETKPTNFNTNIKYKKQSWE